PFNMRVSMAVWNALFLDDRPFAPDPTHDAEWNRGAYLVGPLEHCSACHTPRGFLMQELTSEAFAGAPLGAWYAPNITSDPIAGIGEWRHEDIVTYLRTGRVPGKAQGAGGMAEAVTHSLAHLTDADLRAIATYLGTIPPRPSQGATKPSFSWGAPTSS